MTPGTGRIVMCITGVGAGPAGAKRNRASERPQDDLRLHHGEVGADADAWAGAEGQVGVAIALHCLGREAARVEGVRFLPEQAMAVQGIDIDEHGVVRPDLAVVEPVRRAARYAPSNPTGG